MTDHEAKYILNKHTLLFNMALKDECVPDAGGAIQEIAAVVWHYEAHRHIDFGCGSCVFKLLKDANQIRLSLNATYPDEPKEYKFPKQ